jgi:hypothetical protein
MMASTGIDKQLHVEIIFRASADGLLSHMNET